MFLSYPLEYEGLVVCSSVYLQNNQQTSSWSITQLDIGYTTHCEPHYVGEKTFYRGCTIYRHFRHVLFRFRAMLTLPVVCGVVAVLASLLPLFSADHPSDGPFLYTTKGLSGYLEDSKSSVVQCLKDVHIASSY